MSDIPRIALLVSFLAIPICILQSADLYDTDFDTFTAGPDQWVGTDGWLGSSVGLGVHGIDDGVVPALDKTAFLGGSQPATNFVTVLRPVNVDPAAAGTPLMSFESLMGIEDSQNFHRDSFFFSFYNTSGRFLASIRFSNEPSSFGVWRLDGSAQHDTGGEFFLGELHLLYVLIDFEANRWSADLDGIPLFSDEPFNATGQVLTFGSAAAEWKVAAAIPSAYGDNWMLVADWSIRGIPRGQTPFLFDSVRMTASNSVLLTWPGDPGFDYQLKYTTDFLTWNVDLPDSVFSNVASPQTLTYVDTQATTNRFYRVRRTATP